jgi:hypothetical protein
MRPAEPDAVGDGNTHAGWNDVVEHLRNFSTEWTMRGTPSVCARDRTATISAGSTGPREV